MASLIAGSAIDMTNINLNWFSQHYVSANLADNSFINLNGVIYEDTYVISGSDGFDSLDMVALGFGMSLNGQGAVVSGTVNVLGETLTGGTGLWAIVGTSLSASAIYQAGLTASNTDDIELIKIALNGNDTLNLSNGGDVAGGFNGNDSISGNGGSDILAGHNGNDRIIGGAGNDVIAGGSGKDVLSGNSGRDTFIFAAASDSRGSLRDTITDFSVVNDYIDLSGMDARSNQSGNQAFKFIGGQGFSGHAGEVRFSNHMISGDINGDGHADFQIYLQGHSTLHRSDFYL